MVRRSAPYSLIAAARAFCCRLDEHSLPTTRAAVAWPPLTEAATRSEVCQTYPLAGPLLTRRINTQLIIENWDEMLRLAASLKYGHVTASLIVAKLSRGDA